MHTLLISVFRDANGYDCTNNGISSKFTNLHMVRDSEVSQLKPEDITDDLVVRVDRNLFGKPAPYLTPYKLYKSGKIVMFGGNFGYTSDSRFGDTPLAIHDRVETQEEYNRYSN